MYPVDAVLETEEVTEEVTEAATEEVIEDTTLEEAEEVTDPFLEPSEEIDFNTFIKNLNAAGKSAESAESATGDAN